MPSGISCGAGSRAARRPADRWRPVQAAQADQADAAAVAAEPCRARGGACPKACARWAACSAVRQARPLAQPLASCLASAAALATSSAWRIVPGTTRAAPIASVVQGKKRFTPCRSSAQMPPAARGVVEQIEGLAREVLHDALAALQPVAALEQQHEVVPAHVPDEVPLRIAVRHGQPRHEADHLVAAPVAVVVVEGLEVVQVGIAGHELRAAVDQPLHVQADGNVARQEGEGLACRAASMRASVTLRTNCSPVPRPT